MLSFLHKKRFGFTLVEVMIVIAIIGLLAAIAIPSFMRARRASLLKQIGVTEVYPKDIFYVTATKELVDVDKECTKITKRYGVINIPIENINDYNADTIHEHVDPIKPLQAEVEAEKPKTLDELLGKKKDPQTTEEYQVTKVVTKMPDTLIINDVKYQRVVEPVKE